MSKGNLMNNTKTRRKGSMLQDSLSKMKYFFVLAVLLVLPMQAMAQIGPGALPIIDQTDTGVDRLVAFWDTRSRDTFVQVTNTSSSKVNIHVQIYDVLSPFRDCEECNFPDMLSGFDTHVYNLEDIMTNSIPSAVPPVVSIPRCTEIGPDTYGFIVISLVDGPSDSLIGMFRIIDESGYEYRANAAGSEDRPPNDFTVDQVVNFSDANGHNLSDLVGISYVDIGGTFLVHASPGVMTNFGDVRDEVLVWDEIELPTSCSATTFACVENLMDKGIDNALPNSKGEPNRVCPASTLDSNTAGWLDLPFASFTCTDPLVTIPGTTTCSERPHFVGFIGLNNGDGTGSMDSWWEVPFFGRIIPTPGGPSTDL